MASSGPTSLVPYKSIFEPLRPVQVTAPPEDRLAIDSVSHEERIQEDQRALKSPAKPVPGAATGVDEQNARHSDQCEEELALMADVRANFKVASRVRLRTHLICVVPSENSGSCSRIIDHVPLIINYELLYGFAKDLQTHLIKALGLGADDAVAKCESYIAEEPHIVAEREALTAKRQRLLGVLAELRKAGMM